MSDKTWGTTATGVVFHDFGVWHAECRKNIRPDRAPLRTEESVNEALADVGSVIGRNYRKCIRCTELAAESRTHQEPAPAPEPVKCPCVAEDARAEGWDVHAKTCAIQSTEKPDCVC